MGCFDSTLNKRNVTFYFGSFVLTLNKEAQGKLILSFDLLGLEIAFPSENDFQIKIHYMLLSFF